jgi:ABC-2 type transport system ATP-binding protein
MILEFKNVNKSFGEKHVLRDVCFTAQSGKAFGLLGRNGAGKTTSIRILMDVFHADGGQVLLDGKPIEICMKKAAERSGFVVSRVEAVPLD